MVISNLFKYAFAERKGELEFWKITRNSIESKLNTFVTVIIH